MRECDTVQTPIVREHLRVQGSMKSVLDSVCDGWLRCPRPCRQPACIQLPLPCLITLGSEDRPQGGRGGSAWLQDTVDSLTERESRFEGNGGSATLWSRAASNWTQSGLAGTNQQPLNLHIFVKIARWMKVTPENNSGLPVGWPAPYRQRAETPRLLQGRQLASAVAEGLQLVAVSNRRTLQLEWWQDRDLQLAEAPRLQLAAAGAESLQLWYGMSCQKNGVSASKADK